MFTALKAHTAALRCEASVMKDENEDRADAADKIAWISGQGILVQGKLLSSLGSLKRVAI